MNIFDQYLEKIKKILLDQSNHGNLILPDNLDGITAEIPPSKFHSDIPLNPFSSIRFASRVSCNSFSEG